MDKEAVIRVRVMDQEVVDVVDVEWLLAELSAARKEIEDLRALLLDRDKMIQRISERGKAIRRERDTWMKAARTLEDALTEARGG